MKIDQIKQMMIENKTDKLAFMGKCHDCGMETVVKIDQEALDIVVAGGAIYAVNISGKEKLLVKCEACFDRSPRLTNYQPCEVYSRVVGYLRPVEQWNGAK